MLSFNIYNPQSIHIL